jgi:XTP/dITP diphosphohydrolase
MILHAATSNAGKLAEFATSAAVAGAEVLALPGLGAMPEPVEDADTFLGNAELKARAYSVLAPGLLVLCDDSGIAVDALGGAPGVRSARYADDEMDGILMHPPLTRDQRNNALLLSRMRSKSNRRASFVCALALARDGEVLLRAEGFCSGELLDQPRGDKGFGYDPLFLIPALGLTMAELPREQKWRISHRGNAFRALLAQLEGAAL